MMTFLHTIFHNMRIMQRLSIRFERVSVSELLVQVEEAETAAQLTKVVNNVQDYLWSLPANQQTALRQHLVPALTTHVLHASEMSLRLEATRWLRLLIQAGVITQPKDVFTIFVTAVTHATQVQEQRAYLKLLFECFWPFRHPYPAYTWEDFPANEVFYPLASLLAQTDLDIQSALLAIFAELPTLNDKEITDYLLPVALHWSHHSDPEYRRRITDVLARMNDACAQEALQCLIADSDPIVQANARRAASYTQHT
jgi:hypothetical protein